MCAESTKGTDIAKGRITARCQWGEAEESNEASQEYQRECKRGMESLPRRWHYRMKKEKLLDVCIICMCIGGGVLDIDRSSCFELSSLRRVIVSRKSAWIHRGAVSATILNYFSNKWNGIDIK
jgi:hypothetical protein